MEAKIEYQVIYTLDTKDKISNQKPSYIKYPTFKVTEDEPEHIDSNLTLNHRKYVGILSAEQVSKILNEESFRTCKTLGAITLDFGWIPAISFDFETYGFNYKNAYISPILTAESEDAIGKELDRLTPAQYRNILENEIQPKMGRLIDILESLDTSEDIQLPATMELNVKQLRLDLGEEPKNDQSKMATIP